MRIFTYFIYVLCCNYCMVFSCTSIAWFSVLNWIYVCVLSHVQLFAPPWTVGHQAPLSIEFSRQEYWSGLLFPTPGDLSHPGIKPMCPALAGRFFTTVPPWKLSRMEWGMWNMPDIAWPTVSWWSSADGPSLTFSFCAQWSRNWISSEHC